MPFSSANIFNHFKREDPPHNVGHVERENTKSKSDTRGRWRDCCNNKQTAGRCIFLSSLISPSLPHIGPYWPSYPVMYQVLRVQEMYRDSQSSQTVAIQFPLTASLATKDVVLSHCKRPSSRFQLAHSSSRLFWVLVFLPSLVSRSHSSVFWVKILKLAKWPRFSLLTIYSIPCAGTPDTPAEFPIILPFGDGNHDSRLLDSGANTFTSNAISSYQIICDGYQRLSDLGGVLPALHKGDLSTVLPQSLHKHSWSSNLVDQSLALSAECTLEMKDSEVQDLTKEDLISVGDFMEAYPNFFLLFCNHLKVAENVVGHPIVGQITDQWSIHYDHLITHANFQTNFHVIF
ncbi:hypothetical protein DFH07DRAFT_764953 [Mycena maculata]|uniref:Uncharacterized protein n=1 Tax=Mycena maculata TaxID=230809 RepID=A0AAD7KBI4_9AGAR|nr:hypothetical protein DFH07DRAFT_764953 [Mycena maculata]